MGLRQVGRGVGVPACWGLRPPRDSTPCPRHWFGLFGLRPRGRGCRRLRCPPAGCACGAPPEWWSLRLSGRGAPLPASPCSFVAGHHVFGVGWADRRVGVVLRSPLTLVPSSRGTTSLGADGLPARVRVVLHSPLTLVPSSRGTTSLGSDGPPASWAWCFTPREPLFLRRGSPRL